MSVVASIFALSFRAKKRPESEPRVSQSACGRRRGPIPAWTDDQPVVRRGRLSESRAVGARLFSLGAPLRGNLALRADHALLYEPKENRPEIAPGTVRTQGGSGRGAVRACPTCR